LLACMLARMFDDAKVSTAVWVELVHERQKEVERSVGSGEVVSASSVMAARQAISREQLALFDAGARAWLNSADEAKMSEQKRLMLILKNIPAWGEYWNVHLLKSNRCLDESYERSRRSSEWNASRNI